MRFAIHLWWVKQEQCHKWLKPLALCKVFWTQNSTKFTHLLEMMRDCLNTYSSSFLFYSSYLSDQFFFLVCQSIVENLGGGGGEAPLAPLVLPPLIPAKFSTVCLFVCVYLSVCLNSFVFFLLYIIVFIQFFDPFVWQYS